MAFYEGGSLYRRDCLHREDPRVELRPDMFIDGDRGVFDFVDSEKESRDLKAKMDGLEVLLDELVARVTELDEKTTPKPPTKSKR